MTPECNSDETFSSRIHHELKPSAKQFTNHPQGESLPICFQGLEKVKDMLNDLTVAANEKRNREVK